MLVLQITHEPFMQPTEIEPSEFVNEKDLWPDIFCPNIVSNGM